MGAISEKPVSAAVFNACGSFRAQRMSEKRTDGRRACARCPAGACGTGTVISNHGQHPGTDGRGDRPVGGRALGFGQHYRDGERNRLSPAAFR